MFNGDAQPSDDDLRLREGFINAVATRITELQAAPHSLDEALLAKLDNAQVEYQRGYRDGWAALLERVDGESPTEGAIALAQAHLEAADWYQTLPNNAMQDAAVLELAGRVEGTIGEYLEQRQEK